MSWYVKLTAAGPQGAIDAWKQSIALEPSADAYTNLGSAHMMTKPPQTAEAITALTAAMEFAPDDPEIQYNLAAVLESSELVWAMCLGGGEEGRVP